MWGCEQVVSPACACLCLPAERLFHPCLFKLLLDSRVSSRVGHLFFQRFTERALCRSPLFSQLESRSSSKASSRLSHSIALRDCIVDFGCCMLPSFVEWKLHRFLFLCICILHGLSCPVIVDLTYILAVMVIEAVGKEYFE